MKEDEHRRWRDLVRRARDENCDDLMGDDVDAVLSADEYIRDLEQMRHRYGEVAEANARAIFALERQRDDQHSRIRDLEEQVGGLKRMLCDLTIGGSEFVDKPDRCAAWIRERLDTTLQQALSASAERNELRNQVERLKRKVYNFDDERAFLAGCEVENQRLTDEVERLQLVIAWWEVPEWGVAAIEKSTNTTRAEILAWTSAAVEAARKRMEATKHV